ncbi:MAG: hypothetical protein HEQ39_19670 [Rhizobacter sp.]
MTTELENKEELKKIIESFFKFSGTPVPWNGVVNDGVAAVFYNMLRTTAECSKALSFVPRPSGGPASVLWLVTQLGWVGYRNIENRLSVSCAKKAIANLRSDFQLATMGVAAVRLQKWA